VQQGKGSGLKRGGSSENPGGGGKQSDPPNWEGPQVARRGEGKGKELSGRPRDAGGEKNSHKSHTEKDQKGTEKGKSLT